MPQVANAAVLPPLSNIGSQTNTQNAGPLSGQNCSSQTRQFSSLMASGLLNHLGVEHSSAEGECDASTSEENNSLEDQISSLSQQLISLINQQQQGGGGNSGNSGQGDDQETDGTTAVTTTTTGNGVGDVTNNLTTIVSVDTLNQNRARWDQAAVSGNYSYSLTRRDNASNTQQIDVTVSNGQASAANSGGSAYTGTVFTIDQLFDTIRQAHANGQRADALYHPELGYPTFVYLGNDPATLQDDVSLILRDVRVG